MVILRYTKVLLRKRLIFKSLFVKIIFYFFSKDYKSFRRKIFLFLDIDKFKTLIFYDDVSFDFFIDFLEEFQSFFSKELIGII